MANPICPHCNGVYAAEDPDGWLTCLECGFRFSRTTTGVLIMAGPTGEPVLLPIESERHTAEAGKGHVVELTGSLPVSQLPHLQAAAEAVGQAGRNGNPFFPPDPEAPRAVSGVMLRARSAEANRQADRSGEPRAETSTQAGAPTDKRVPIKDIPEPFIEMLEWLRERVGWLRSSLMTPGPENMAPGLVEEIVALYGKNPNEVKVPEQMHLLVPKDPADRPAWANVFTHQWMLTTIHRMHGWLESHEISGQPDWAEEDPQKNPRAAVRGLEHLSALLNFVGKILPVKSANPKIKARDKWIYRKCCEGIAHDKIVAELKRTGPKRGWPIISTKQRIQQIGKEYAAKNGLPPPPSRRSQ
jgi:hypothetical protein